MKIECHLIIKNMADPILSMSCETFNYLPVSFFLLQSNKIGHFIFVCTTVLCAQSKHKYRSHRHLVVLKNDISVIAKLPT